MWDVGQIPSVRMQPVRITTCSCTRMHLSYCRCCAIMVLFLRWGHSYAYLGYGCAYCETVLKQWHWNELILYGYNACMCIVYVCDVRYLITAEIIYICNVFSLSIPFFMLYHSLFLYAFLRYIYFLNNLSLVMINYYWYCHSNVDLYIGSIITVKSTQIPGYSCQTLDHQKYLSPVEWKIHAWSHVPSGNVSSNVGI